MCDLKIYKINKYQLQISCNFGVANKIANHFSTFIANRWFHPLVKSKRWDGRIFFFNKKDHIISIGFIKDLLVFCNEQNLSYKFEFNIEELFSNITKEQISLFIKSLSLPQDRTPYDYQEKSVYLAIKNKNGIMELATGSGKSLIIYIIIRYLILLNKKILIIVPSVSLVNQLLSDFKNDYKWSEVEKYVTILYSGQKIDLNKMVLISTWQSLADKKSDEFFQQFGVYIVDECLHPDTIVHVKEKYFSLDNKKLLYWKYYKKKIKDVKTGDLIRCYDFEKKKIRYEFIEKIYKNLSIKKNNVYKITFDDNSYERMTGNHNILKKNGKKKQVKNLKIGEEVWI